MKILKIVFISAFFISPLFAQKTESNFINISKIGLSVSNLEISKEFYSKVFKLKPNSKPIGLINGDLEKRMGHAFAKGKSLVLDGENSSLELMEFKGKIGKYDFLLQNPGITHVCYQSSTNQPMYTRAISNDAVAYSRGDNTIDRGYGIRYAYVNDPDHVIFELEELEKPPFESEILFGHVAVSTDNIDSLVAFYTKLFNYGPRNRIDNIKNSKTLDAVANIDGLLLRGAWFTVGQMSLEIWEFENPKPNKSKVDRKFEQIGYNKITFDLKNFEDEMNRLNALGIKPELNRLKNRALLYDIDGNLLEFLKVENNE